MSYTSNPCWWTIVQVFAPRPDWSRTLGWRTCKQNAAPIRIFWYSYQKLVAREGSRACQQLRHLQLVCFISSHSFHSTFSGTYRPSALGIQGFQAQNPWHLLESFERIVFFLAWNLHTCQVTFVQLKLRMLKKSMVWWYGMQNPRKICMEHLVQGSKTSYIYIYIYIWCLFSSFPSFPPFKSSVPSKKLVKPAMIPAKAVVFGFGALKCKCFTFMEAHGKQKVPPLYWSHLGWSSYFQPGRNERCSLCSKLPLSSKTQLLTNEKKNMWYW